MIITLILQGSLPAKRYRFDIAGRVTDEWAKLSDPALDYAIADAAGHLYPLPAAPWSRGIMKDLLGELVERGRATAVLTFHQGDTQ